MAQSAEVSFPSQIEEIAPSDLDLDPESLDCIDIAGLGEDGLWSSSLLPKFIKSSPVRPASFGLHGQKKESDFDFGIGPVSLWEQLDPGCGRDIKSSPIAPHKNPPARNGVNLTPRIIPLATSAPQHGSTGKLSFSITAGRIISARSPSEGSLKMRPEHEKIFKNHSCFERLDSSHTPASSDGQRKRIRRELFCENLFSDGSPSCAYSRHRDSSGALPTLHDKENQAPGYIKSSPAPRPAVSVPGARRGSGVGKSSLSSAKAQATVGDANNAGVSAANPFQASLPHVAAAKGSRPTVSSCYDSDTSFISGGSNDESEMRDELNSAQLEGSDEESLSDPYYEEFLRNIVSRTSSEQEDDDDDDEVYDLNGDLDREKQVHYRIRDHEMKCLLDDCHSILQDHEPPLLREIKGVQNEAASSSSRAGAEASLPREGVPAENTIEAAGPFRYRHLDKIKHQLEIHFQLLVQLFGLCFENGSNEAGAQMCFLLLQDLKMRKERSLGMQGRHILFPFSSGDNSKRRLPSPQAPPFPFYPTIFGLEGLEKLALLKPISDKIGLSLKGRQNASLQKKGEPRTIGPFNDTHAGGPSRAPLHSRTEAVSVLFSVLNALFGGSFHQQYLCLPFRSDSNTNRVRFVDAEDKLMLRGLRRFGPNQWDMIHTFLLPAKSPKQIATRYKNLVSRTAPPNPVKEFYFQQFLPLSLEEKRLLLKGLEKHGNQFQLVSREFLPYRPGPYLKKIWSEELRQKSLNKP